MDAHIHRYKYIHAHTCMHIYIGINTLMHIYACTYVCACMYIAFGETAVLPVAPTVIFSFLASVSGIAADGTRGRGGGVAAAVSAWLLHKR